MRTECYAGREDCDCATYETEDIGGMRIIRQPGKFVSETPATVHFWNIGLDGCADRDVYERGQWVYKFRITASDRRVFPELRGKGWFSLVESDTGFVGQA